MTDENIIQFPETPCEERINRGARMINEALNDESVHMFRCMVINWLCSPQLLCVLQNDELHYLRDMIEQEQKFRLSERKMVWSR